MEASDLAIRMVEFADSHPLGQPQSKTASNRDSPAIQQLQQGVASNSSSSTTVSGGIASAGGSYHDSPLAGIIESSLSQQSALRAPTPIAASTSSAAAEVSVHVADYGAVPCEPADGEQGVVKVSIKLISGKTSVRRYRSSDKVQGLFAVVAALEPEAATRAFDLVTRYPALSLVTCPESTLGECGLAGVQVIMKWV